MALLDPNKYSLTCITCNHLYQLSFTGVDLCPKCNSIGELVVKPDFFSKLTLETIATFGHDFYGSIDVQHLSKVITSFSRISQGSGSVKDRASILAVLQARSLGHSHINVASCGNAALSTAYWGSLLNLHVNVFMSKNAPSSYFTNLQSYGASIFSDSQNYSQSLSQCTHYSLETDTYCRNTGVNSLTRIGKSTLWSSMFAASPGYPVSVVIPIGDGNLFSSFLYWLKYIASSKSKASIKRVIGFSSSPFLQKITLSKLTCDHDTSLSQINSLSVSLPTDIDYLLRNLSSELLPFSFYMVPDSLFLERVNSLYSSSRGCSVTNGMLNLIGHLSQNDDHFYIPITAINRR